MGLSSRARLLVMHHLVRVRVRVRDRVRVRVRAGGRVRVRVGGRVRVRVGVGVRVWARVRVMQCITARAVAYRFCTDLVRVSVRVRSGLGLG